MGWTGRRRKYSVVGTRIIIIIENLLGFTTLRLYSDLTNKGPRSSYVCAASPVLNEATALPALICLYPLTGGKIKGISVVWSVVSYSDQKTVINSSECRV